VRSKRAQRGETLVELMVSLGIVAIILSMTTALYVQMFNHYQKVATDVNAQSEARFAMGRATQALRQAMTDPNQTNQLPVVYPTAGPSGASPSPAAYVRFQVATNMPANADFTALTYQNEELTTSSTGVPAGQNPNLVLNVWDSNWANILSTSIIGRDVKSFVVVPMSPQIYDLQMTIVPPYGMSQGAQASTPTSSFVINSRVYISYYQPN
jgi:prepilin-type N-terminal cleavage/methylation domain-containing protein